VSGALWSRLSLRWRLMVIGLTGLSVGLLLAGWLLLAVLGWAVDRSVDTSARQTATDIAGLIEVGKLPQPVPVVGSQLVQVVDTQNRVRVGSPGAGWLVPLLEPDELRRALSGRRLVVDGARIGLEGPLRVSAIAAGPATDAQSVIVAVPVGDIREATQYLKVALLGLFAPLVAGLALIAWWVIGRTLRPVEALRAGAEEITGQSNAGAEQRLPVPAGRDEIHRLAVTLNDMLDRLGSARLRQRQFVADAAHELRNPVAGIRTQLEVARRHPDGTDWGELTEDLLIDTERLATLADDLLLLARADEWLAARPPVAVPVAETLAVVAARYREARVPVLVEDAGPDLKVHADPEDLHRVLTNLVDNAVRYARSEVRLAAVAHADDQIRITVTDDGPGIPEADRERVFARFVRLDDARAVDDGGTGLGLAIVAELLRRHAGTIRLGDAGPGVRAEVLLPSDPSDPSDPSPNGPSDARPGAPSGQDLRG
jgi:signal transduction histidine kinase